MLVCPILATEFVCLGFLEVFIHHRGCKSTGQLNESTRFWSCCTKLKIKTNTTSTGTSVAVVKNIKKVKMLPSGTPLFFGTALSLSAILNAGIRTGTHVTQGERCSMEMGPGCERHRWQMISWRGREASNPEGSLLIRDQVWATLLHCLPVAGSMPYN